MASKFVHLHTHSHYSLLNALPKIKALVDAAKKNNMTALALTDNGNMYGTIEFYKECVKKEIKPIIGVDAYLAPRSRNDKQAGVDKDRFRLVLLCQNETGYKNLIKLVTLSHLEGFYYKPRMDREILEKYHEGIIAIAPSFNSDIINSLKMSDMERAEEKIDWYKKTFGAENFFLEITHHPEIEGHDKMMKKIVELAHKTQTPLLATHDVYYIEPEDKVARQTLLSIQNQSDEKVEAGNEDFSFISPEKAEEYFKDLPEAIYNTVEVAERCNLKLDLGQWVFPNYTVQNGKSYDDELERITYEGIISHGLKETEEIKNRIDYELKVIKDKGYAPYFLVVSDLLRHARKHGIMSTTRGSAAGSMVSYLTYITTVDPISYELPFERFLNPERPSAPDIDMDIADNRRDDMIKYARDKYGDDKVAQIGTFGTMMARGSVRDVTRALGFPYSLGDSIAKIIPMGAQGFPMTIDRAMEEVPELLERYKTEKDVATIIDMAKKIEGCARHISVHAAGVVISPKALTDFVPLQYETKGEQKLITQYEMHAVEDAGLLKFDFLGIRNLAILADAVRLVKKLEGIEIDIENIPLDNKKTFEMLARGETIGLFQLNGDGMTRWLKELRPTTVFDINVMVALYRPGPMNNINEYIARKHGKNKVVYMHPKMKDFLDRTYGVMVYQDDLLMTAIHIAGYSWGEVDKFRKAVGKKIPEEMKKQHVMFVEGCQKNGGMSAEKAEDLWKLFEPFQGYGFNKAHAASYGKVAYQTAYMKANFPVIYMTAVLTAESGDIEKVAEIIAECKRMGISVLPPDINQSFTDFTVVKGLQSENTKDCIRFGLKTIKNFGEGIAETIINERKNNGQFVSISDFLRRVKDKNLNKKSLESLVKVGAMDSLGDRETFLHNLENLLLFNKEERAKKSEQTSLFSEESTSATEVHLEKTPEVKNANRLLWEKELLGLYISGHPLDGFRHKFENKETDIKKVKTEKNKKEVVFGALIDEIRPIVTKDGERMFFLKLSDLNDTIEGVVFPRAIAGLEDILVPENCVVIKGIVSTRNDEKSVIVEKMKMM